MYLAEPLLAGIHAGDVDRLSLRALFPRFAEAERQDGSLIRGFRRRAIPPSAAGAFKSLPGGLSEMVRALVRALPPDAVRTSAPVARVGETPRKQFRVEISGGASDECRALVLATPTYVTATLIRNHSTELARLCAEIPYSSIATVALAFPRDAIQHPLNGSGYVVPRTEGSGILAATWLSSKWPSRAPNGKVLLRTFIGGSRDPAALAHSDADLIARSIAAVRPLLGIRGDPVLTRVYRFDRASAQHEVGHLERVKIIDRLLTGHPGLFLTGSGLRGVGIPDCIADARATAIKVDEWLKSTPVNSSAVKSATTEDTEQEQRSR
jgi:oxygen-dependent protoporphyrinogen oxidase